MINLHQDVRTQERRYISGKNTISKYVQFSMYETIETIDAYLNSKHISGEVDSLGREKPFFNIVTATANIWFRATDIDRKDIRVLPDEASDTAIAFLATVVLQQWMREERMGVFFNEWGRIMSRYGSAVVKFVEQNGKLVPSVIPWNRLIVDPIDFYAQPRIEKFYKTAAQLKNMATKGHPDYCGYDLTAVNALIAAHATIVRKTIQGQDQDTNPDYFEIYEVHDTFPDYLLLDEKPTSVNDEDVKYFPQMHVITFIEMANKEFEDFSLFKGREAQDPYMKTDLIVEDGRTLAIGAVEYLFDTQWMQNHTMKNMKDTLDLASKLIFQTADQNFYGRNVLSAIETGDILITAENKPISVLQNRSSSIGDMTTFMDEWNSMSMQLTNTPDAMRGSIPRAGTAYRLQALIAQQAENLFDVMTQNKGLAVEDMMRKFILPYVKKQLNTTKQIVALMDDNAVQQLDEMWIPKEAVRQYNNHVKDSLLSGTVPAQFDKAAMEANVQGQLSQLGNTRFLAPSDVPDVTWKEALKGLEMRVIVDVTGESTDSATVLQTLTQMLQTIATNPQLLQDPNAKMLFSRILTETGVISPMQIAPTPALPPQGDAQPDNAPAPTPTPTPAPTVSPPKALTGT